ncbi:kinesin-like protein KIN-14C isoform X1 [Physcomitrium patens]|uniref:Kinesin motor domain-containing protein n=1 Tax=Physcomitrium patens TaxID=3218 RepID=A0A7I4BDQ0_PHYPA|nr:kinesin-like protein KIN-14I isoform X1 [Physcomitrium patens]XP_024400705.1 kinesin-like protein KIN-14I isoform X1 [Physcomitrium patens]XP_024400706.1 kinesin-like protein KIN-14I isoform X1 [Physcomitrium patens]|eukprot:XP_024400704.1 kinesin-like protein KIN-14I isoform X1 [Physcomitrella patens]
MDVARMGYENGSSTVFSSVEGTMSHGLGLSVNSWYEGNETFYDPEKRIPGIERPTGQAYKHMNQGHMNHATGSIVNDAVSSAGVRLSDTHLASRKAEEAASRRQHAISWLQGMVGSLGLSSDSTEEDLRLCLRNGINLCKLINKVQPGAVQKVVVNAVLSNHPDGAQSAFQYFENVRNFLVAIEEMGLPSFEVSDLEQGSMSSSSSAKLVDCILALKSYHDWKQGGALGFWRLKSPSHPPVNMNKSVSKSSHSKSDNRSANAGIQWAIPDLDGTSVPSTFKQSTGFEYSGPFSGHTAFTSDPSGENNSPVGDAEEVASIDNSSAVPSSTWLQHLGDKFHEVLQVNAKSMHGVADSIPFTTDDYGGEPTPAVDNAPSQSLLSLINAILCDKSGEEVPMAAEFMLHKVMEEFKRHLVTQRKQVTRMKSSMKEIMAREFKLASQNSVLLTLAGGTQEELKLYAQMLRKIEAEIRELKEDKRAKEEEIYSLLKENEKQQSAVQMLTNELDLIKRSDKQLQQRLEDQKKELEQGYKETIQSMELQLQGSYEKLEVARLNAANEMSSLRLQDTQYQTFLSNQLLECRDLRLAQLNTKDEVLNMQTDWKNQFIMLEEQLQNMARAASGYHKVLAENRMLYNEVQDLKGNIRVYCRVRPFLAEEAGRLSTLDYIGENGELMLVNPLKPGAKDSRKSFTFNKCFPPTASQEEVFLDTQPLIRSVLDGFNVCIFAYGQTGSGKTYTMSGPNNMTSIDWGVNYRALHDLFHITQSRQDVFRYEIGVQMLEIYNEQVRDLLSVDGAQKKLEIRNNSQLNGLNVPDASRMSVRSTEDVLDLMKVGQKNRAVGATALNERSSRSHSVLTVHVHGTDLESGAVLRGSLHLVDLAGSERVDRSEATGDRLKEAQHINKSLSALGDVIAALAQKNGHVPYRNSKLTQLLQDSLGGQAKTLMFVHISPDVESFGETVSTLKFAERVSTVELGAARSNKESGEIQNLREQVALLKEAAAKKDAEIAQLQAFKERCERGESGVGTEKLRSRSLKSSARVRPSTDISVALKLRTAQNENGSGTMESRPITRKLPSQPKSPLRESAGFCHDSEVPAELLLSSSVCSPTSSPTEQGLSLFDVMEDGVNTINEKLKFVKHQRNGSGTGVGSWTSPIRGARDIDNGQLKASEGSKHLETILANNADSSSSCLGKEVLARELPVGSQQGAENSGNLSLEVENQRIHANGGSFYEGNGDFEGIRSVCSSQRSLQGLEEQFESDGIFDLRDGCDDSSSLFSESGLSVEADLSSPTHLDQNKKVQSGHAQVRNDRRALTQTQVPRPPISSTRKTSSTMERKPVGAPLHIRPRRHTNVGISSSTEKLVSKRNASIGAVSNSDFELNGNRRVAVGAGSSTSWR